MKACFIIFHKNIQQYPKSWTEMFLSSIKKQTKKIPVLECDYGNKENQIYKKSIFFNKDYPTHAHAHNFLCHEAVRMGFNAVFNTNVDDIYHFQRVEKQLPYMEAGYDVVSCDMTQIDQNNIVLREDIRFSQMDIEHNGLQRNHNIIAHPGCVYSKNFIENRRIVTGKPYVFS